MAKHGYARGMSALVHYIIDGREFSSIKAVHRAAKERGSDLSSQSLFKRMQRGASTWPELLKPIDVNHANGRATRKATAAASRAECAAIMAEMDRRKAAMGVNRG